MRLLSDLKDELLKSCLLEVGLLSMVGTILRLDFPSVGLTELSSSKLDAPSRLVSVLLTVIGVTRFLLLFGCCCCSFPGVDDCIEACSPGKSFSTKSEFALLLVSLLLFALAVVDFRDFGFSEWVMKSPKQGELVWRLVLVLLPKDRS